MQAQHSAEYKNIDVWTIYVCIFRERCVSQPRKKHMQATIVQYPDFVLLNSWSSAKYNKQMCTDITG